MKRLVIAAVLAASACGSPQPQDPAQEKSAQLPSVAETEGYIRRSSEQWAAGDAAAMKVFLADDYEGVASTGEVRTKARQLELVSEPSPYSSSQVDYVNFRHLGHTVIAQGAETHVRADGGPDLRLIWLDIWMFRGGKWQVAASQDSVRPPST